MEKQQKNTAKKHQVGRSYISRDEFRQMYPETQKRLAAKALSLLQKAVTLRSNSHSYLVTRDHPLKTTYETKGALLLFLFNGKHTDN
jgi:CHASE3 domain sensor protein